MDEVNVTDALVKKYFYYIRRECIGAEIFFLEQEWKFPNFLEITNSEMFSVNDTGYYLFEQERLMSFKYWKFNDDLACNKFALAAAGFYKSNPDEDGSDECVCFYCDKALGDWDPDDDPFKEHKSHSPKCKFINLDRRESELKVKEFLELVESWCLNNMNKIMDNGRDKRGNLFTKFKSNVEVKFRK